jgi:DNA primase
MAVQHEHDGVYAYWEEQVVPAVFERLPQVFPEFGWRPDARGWFATDQEFLHARFGINARRVVAHRLADGRPPQGFLVHGGYSMLWTEYVNDGTVPKHAEFARVVREIAERASVDTTPLDHPRPRDPRSELFERFFELARNELTGDRGAKARAYLERRGFPPAAIENTGLGVVPPAATTRQALLQSGFRKEEIDAAGILANPRWPGRLCGAWRNESGRIGTFWARAVDENVAPDDRYLYLRGASWAKLPPYGFQRRTRELVLVEGFLDYHQLAAHGVDNAGALGSTRTTVQLFEHLSRLGVATVVLCLDNDRSGRDGTVRAIENAARARTSPAVHVANTDGIGAKDPDALVREHGTDAWRKLIDRRECGIVWRVKEMVKGIHADTPLEQRRQVLRETGAWLGTLPPRLALEQEDAVKLAAERCGYSPEAARRDFQKKYFHDLGKDVLNDVPVTAGVGIERKVEAGIDL